VHGLEEVSFGNLHDRAHVSVGFDQESQERDGHGTILLGESCEGAGRELGRPFPGTVESVGLFLPVECAAFVLSFCEPARGRAAAVSDHDDGVGMIAQHVASVFLGRRAVWSMTAAERRRLSRVDVGDATGFPVDLEVVGGAEGAGVGRGHR